jgi:hypothetical protein
VRTAVASGAVIAFFPTDLRTDTVHYCLAAAYPAIQAVYRVLGLDTERCTAADVEESIEREIAEVLPWIKERR